MCHLAYTLHVSRNESAENLLKDKTHEAKTAAFSVKMRHKKHTQKENECLGMHCM